MVYDVAFKVHSQGHAHRFVCYHREQLHVFPAGFGAEAIEVGPCTARSGPCLVLFRGVTTPPDVVAAWLEATLLKWAIFRVLWLGTSSEFQAESREELVEKLLQLAAPLRGALRVQCEPRDLEAWLVSQLVDRVQLHPVKYAHAMHVLHCEGRYRFSAQPGSLLFRTSPTMAPRVGGDRLSKAAGKLAEALEVAQFQSNSGLAVDLGAAPGGWTAFLAKRVRRVVAIDPAPLDPRALQHNVTHLACRAEQALEGLWQQLVAWSGTGGGACCEGDKTGRVCQRPDDDGSSSGGTGCDCCGRGAGASAAEACTRGGLADVVCCDMNFYLTEVLPVLREVLPLLRPGGLLIFTLKFCGHGRDKSDWGGGGASGEGRLATELRPLGFSSVQMVWLLANTMSERTCIAVKDG